eukprot:NODE_3337_length_680_cov_58.362916_g2372_i0.p4 GENE.NODE_3337_length_680_cov_58.362916_g2372_i0~~NODE_3337_length_680_cov_58.362916_g2372_i0.p4  ORF type:complete len:59 (-),score=9.24 NODE_3337_length_680_cov_58.362916_g2372_i0:502-657(-)
MGLCLLLSVAVCVRARPLLKDPLIYITPGVGVRKCSDRKKSAPTRFEIPPH